MRTTNIAIGVLSLVAVFLTCTSSVAQTVATFGPTRYTRARGAPATFTETFPRCAGGACQLVVVNGNPDGSNRVSSDAGSQLASGLGQG